MASAFAPAGAPARVPLTCARVRFSGSASTGRFAPPANPTPLNFRRTISDGSRQARSHVLSEDDTARDVDDRTGSSASRDTKRTQIEIDLENARAAARAADMAAEVAEKEHNIFLTANKLLLDARTAEAESTRNAAQRAAEIAYRARTAADEAAKFARKTHEIALEEANSEACAYEMEANASEKSKLGEEGPDRPEDPDCITREKRAKNERYEAEHQARVAARESAAAAERLVNARIETAERAAKAAEDALARADAVQKKQASREMPALWGSVDDSIDEMDTSITHMDVADAPESSIVPKQATSVESSSSTPQQPPRRILPADKLQRRDKQHKIDEVMASASRRVESEFVGRTISIVEKVSQDEGDDVITSSGSNATSTTGSPPIDSSALYCDDDVHDTIAPMPDWMYPRVLDAIPTFFGRLNLVTGTLVYYTGAVLRESTGAPVVALQWTLFVFLPILASQFLFRKWRHEANALKVYQAYLELQADYDTKTEESTKEQLKSAWPGTERAIKSESKKSLHLKKPFSFYRENRIAWLDLHLGYALLCPAGAVGGDGASWWLLLAPVVMALRFVGERFGVLKFLRRVLAVVGGVVALGAVLFSASASLTQALGSARAGGAVALLLSPIAFAVTFAFYLAPASLLPAAIKKAFKGDGAWAGDDVDGSTVKSTENIKPPTSEEEAAEQRLKRTWQVLGVVAFGVSLATGSDVPIFLCFFAQLLKQNPGDMLQIFIDKGDKSKAAFDKKIAEAAGDTFKKLTGDKKDKSNDDEGRGSAPSAA